ncbi:MAG: hypothetical protein WCJ67_03625 [Thermoleophilia bacterium]
MAKLVIVIPALDEGATIGDVISRVPGRIAGVVVVEVIVVDDGTGTSQDRASQAPYSAYSLRMQPRATARLPARPFCASTSSRATPPRSRP